MELSNSALIFLIIFIVFSIPLIIWIPKIQAKKLIDIKDKLDYENKTRATIAQILGGVILLSTFWSSIENIRVSRETITDQLNITSEIADGDRELSRELAELNNEVLLTQIQKIDDNAMKDRELTRADLNERVRQLNETLKDNRAERDLLNKQIRVQQDNAQRQLSASLFSDAVKLVSSSEPTTRISGINILTRLAILDSSYTELSLQLLINLIKVAPQKPNERSINFSMISKIFNHKRELDFDFLASEDGKVFITEDESKIGLRHTYSKFTLKGMDLSKILVRDIYLQDVVIEDCDLSGAFIEGHLGGAVFQNCKMDSARIFSIRNFKLDSVFVFGPGILMNGTIEKGLLTSEYNGLFLFRSQNELQIFTRYNRLHTIRDSLLVKVIITKEGIKYLDDLYDNNIRPYPRMINGSRGVDLGHINVIEDREGLGKVGYFLNFPADDKLIDSRGALIK